MAGQRYNKAYEAYQQAVYRDGRNPTFWCSIGVLYYQINQYRDALDAYSRAIRLNPYISEVWYNLGSLYESCNNQITDAIDAYSRAAELDPANGTIKHRLQLLQSVGPSSGPLPPAPGPVDVHPSQYAATPNNGTVESPNPPPEARLEGIPQGAGLGMGGPPPNPNASGPGIPVAARDLPPPPPGDPSRSPGPFRGGGAAPPPLAHVDESRGSMSRHAPLAPMEIERGGEMRDQRDQRDQRDPYEGHNRFDDRRRPGSPPSPRRGGGGGGPYAGGAGAGSAGGGAGAGPAGLYGAPAPPGYMREREPRSREEWEARERDRERDRRLPPGPPPLDTREARDGRPSPHLPERGLYQPDPRHPSPRMLDGHGLPPGRDYRDSPDLLQQQQHQQQQYADRDRERERYPHPSERYDRDRRYDERESGGNGIGNGNGPSASAPNYGPGSSLAPGYPQSQHSNGGFRHPSMPRDIRMDDPRAPSPAPSNSSRAGKRARDSELVKSSSKRAKDERVVSGAGASAGAGGAKRAPGSVEKREREKERERGEKSPSEAFRAGTRVGARAEEGEWFRDLGLWLCVRQSCRVGCEG